MEFLETLETIQAGDASVSRLFGGEGLRARSAGMRRFGPEQYAVLLAEAADFVADVYEGKRPLRHLQEALTTSDFPFLFGDILDRQLLGNYVEAPQTYRAYCRIGRVTDFRTVKRFALDGAESTLSAVPELTEYPGAQLTDSDYTYSVSKFGRRIAFSWEAILNDDLQALQDIPARFGRAARRSEEKFATGLFVDANGPHASLYTSGNKNIVNTTNGASATNPPLSISALQDAFLVLSKMVDKDGEPIVVDTVQLVVPPALEITARNILNATQLWLTTAGGAVTGLANSSGLEQRLQVQNWMANKTQLSVNYYIPVVAGSANGNTSWFLFANPATSRPALEVGFLVGHDSPEIFIKDPDQRRVGAAGADAMAGNFDTDAIQYKVRHVFGGTRLDPKATVASNGSGS